MLCQMCGKNPAVVEGGWGVGKIKICIPCALSLMDQLNGFKLVLSREVFDGKEEEDEVEVPNQTGTEL